MDLTNTQWELLEGLIPEPPTREDGRGRPWKDARSVLNGILWVLRTGAPWKDLPGRYPPYQTCHRRFQQWASDGTIERILEELALHLEKTGKIDLEEAFIDGTFVSAKKGGPKLEKPNEARAQKSWQLQTATVFLSPLGSKVLRRMKLRSQKCQSKKSSQANQKG